MKGLRSRTSSTDAGAGAGQGTPEGRVGWGFLSLYALAYMSTCLLFLAPLLVSLALKLNALVGIEQAPRSLALVASVGALVAIVANPLCGRLSDRTSSRWGMRRPWMLLGLVGGSLGVLIVAIAPNVSLVLAGWCVAQVFFNALFAAQMAVMSDQVPVAQRGFVAGTLGMCMPIAAVVGTFLVQLFADNQVAMFMVPCAVAGCFVILFAIRLDDRHRDPSEVPHWSLREFASTFYVNPRQNPDFAWAFVSRFMFVLAYVFLTTYQAYYLLDRLGVVEGDVARQVFLGTLAQSVVIVAASVVGGRLSDRTGRRKAFVASASVVYASAMFVIAAATDIDGFLIGMALSGLGFGVYMAVDLALVVDVLPDADNAAKDLGILNIAAALPSSVGPAIAPLILVLGNGSYGLLFTAAGGCALVAAVAIMQVRRVR